MIVDIAWWTLDNSPQTIESLRAHLRDGAVDAWADTPGLLLKLWIADPATNRWGAIMLWEESRPSPDAMPANEAEALIGKPVSERARFSVEASVEGDHGVRSLHAPGTALVKPHAPRAIEKSNRYDYVVVDSFTRTPLEGNPVAVFTDARTLSAERMQRIAKEMNLSEVTFVLPAERGGDARVRIFTPVNELPFAGHPLLGTAVVLRARGLPSRLRLETGMGIFPFEVRTEDVNVAFVTMQQPVPTWEKYEHADALLSALGLRAATLPVEAYRNGPRHVLVGCPDVATLSSIRPDTLALSRFPDMAAICFALAADQCRCRMFSPAYGVAEDAATGSAAGPIAIHLARHKKIPWGRALEILQGVEINRPSYMHALAAGTERNVESVEVSGHGVIVASGQLHA